MIGGCTMGQPFARYLCVAFFLCLPLAAQPRNTSVFEKIDKEHGLEIRVEKQKNEVPGIQEFKVRIRNTKPTERTLHAKITLQDGNTQKECTIYLPMPPSAPAVDTVRCQAGDRAVYWQLEVIKVYDMILVE